MLMKPRRAPCWLGRETVGGLGEEYEVGVGNGSKHIKPTGLQQCLE